MEKYKNLEKLKEVTELKKQLELEMTIAFGKKALELLELKVGDIVKCKFRTSYISRKQSYGDTTIQDGVIKVDERGIIYVESLEPIKQTYNTSNNRTGRDYRSWWVECMKITKAEITAIQELCE